MGPDTFSYLTPALLGFANCAGAASPPQSFLNNPIAPYCRPYRNTTGISNHAGAHCLCPAINRVHARIANDSCNPHLLKDLVCNWQISVMFCDLLLAFPVSARIYLTIAFHNTQLLKNHACFITLKPHQHANRT
jgi:hypothetical protein